MFIKKRFLQGTGNSICSEERKKYIVCLLNLSWANTSEHCELKQCRSRHLNSELQAEKAAGKA